ncbi:MAG TPA: hypothetical protein EYP24_02565, partial [bacterium (Candidatus Stahlbacteria)]|nr:hypothetical protein [Candidatus Stahlbacteria bacterium]
TFGKGSVQNIFPLEDGGALRLTTALWYIASGRCINKREEDTTRSEYHTLGPRRRIVYGGGGITPDIIDTMPHLSDLEQKIYRKGLFFSFAVRYAKRHPEFKEEIKVEPAVLDSFRVFLLDHKLEFTEEEFTEVESRIATRLKVEFAGYLYGIKGRYRYSLPDDSQFEHALRLLKGVSSTEDLFAKIIESR